MKVVAGAKPVPLVTNNTPCCHRPLHLDNVAGEREDGSRFIDATALDFAVNLHLSTCRGR